MREEASSPSTRANKESVDRIVIDVDSSDFEVMGKGRGNVEEDSEYVLVAPFRTMIKLKLTKVNETHIRRAKARCTSWRKKYCIGPDVEIYYRVDLFDHPFLPHTIIFCEGFLLVGIRFSLIPLVVNFFNYIDRVPQ